MFETNKAVKGLIQSNCSLCHLVEKIMVIKSIKDINLTKITLGIKGLKYNKKLFNIAEVVSFK